MNAYSNHLIPKLQGTKRVGPNVYDVGPLADHYLPPNFQAPSSLVQFLDSCLQPPICVGFGSMPFSKVQVILQALEILNRRAILVGNALSIPASYPNVTKEGDFRAYHVSSIPYSFLLPKCSMMLCHGGAGVVQACLYAGIPCLVSPIMGDQFAFAALLQAKQLGVQCGTKLSKLTSQDVVTAVQRTQSSDRLILAKCQQVGKELQTSASRYSVKALADLLEQHRIS